MLPCQADFSVAVAAKRGKVLSEGRSDHSRSKVRKLVDEADEDAGFVSLPAVVL